MRGRWVGPVVAAVLLSGVGAWGQVPASILGRWKIVRVLPTESNWKCWDADRARTLLGTTLEYRTGSMVWQGGEVPLLGVASVTRTLSADQFRQEYQVALPELGIKLPRVTEIVLQHEDADVTGGSTEIPGDTVELAGPGRIAVSACGVFYEAVRAGRR